MATLHRSAIEWEENARANPMWAILTDDDVSCWRENEFFKTGRTEIGKVIDRLTDLGVKTKSNWRCLDFGCGIGRVTRALAERFSFVIGIDVSPTMVSLAKRYSASDHNPPRYLVNKRVDLSVISSESIDFLYSHIVLQHIPSACQKGYIAEFMRVLARGGIAAFQVTTADRRIMRDKIEEGVGKALNAPIPGSALTLMQGPLHPFITAGRGISLEMYICARESIRRIVVDARCRIIDASYTNSTDTHHKGRIVFMCRRKAIKLMKSGDISSPYLSQFFFIEKPL